jgi:hypothetical protein
MSRTKSILALLALFFLAACSSSPSSGPSDAEQEDSADAGPQIFKRLSIEESGIDFRNDIVETKEYNYFAFQYTYNGAGVGVGDLDNDGLPDLYFSGNQVPDRIYRNEGNLKFKDISKTAGIDHQGGFNFGVTFVDINQDGWQDIYVCRSGHKGLTKEKANLLYINNHDLTFTESAQAYGLADQGYSIQSAFFDYDHDGDLDMYLTQHPVDYGQNLKERLDKMKAPEDDISDKMYRNNGDNTFTNVTDIAGVRNYGHGLGLVIWDINEDGWDDIYVGNDYQSADYVYINNQNGTFTDRMKEYFPHIPYYSMGVDVADIDNDGLLDMNVVEMLPENYHRMILNVSDLSEQNYYVFEEVGFHHQYTRNCMFRNNGGKTFSDVAYMAGVEATDWSWSSLFGDYDNDGKQDLFVSNGYLRDMQDKDYIKRSKYIRAAGGRMTKETFDTVTVSQKLRNYLYMNQGNLKFKNRAKSGGLEDVLFSSGAAHADLDNDGDLDLIVNNSNLQLSPDPAIIYENIVNSPKKSIRFDFEGPKGNRDGEGVRIIAQNGEEHFIQELRRTRGFISSMDKSLLIGIGERGRLEQVKVIWPDGAMQELGTIEGGKKIMCKYAEADKRFKKDEVISWAQVADLGIIFKHEDKVMTEFDIEAQLPFRMSMQGPQCAVADVDKNGEEDFFICGAKGQSDELYLQFNGKFTRVDGPWKPMSNEEHIVAEFADVDGDGDMDLYIGSGGTEDGKNNLLLLDKLFINEGKGFRYAENNLPRMLESTSVVTFGDMDGDGDLDAFVGSRSVPFAYGEAPHSFLLINEGGIFKSAAADLAPDILKLEMVSDAAWSDHDADGDLDLIIVGEWSSPVFMKNEGGKLSKGMNLPDLKGLWRTVVSADLNGDGRADFILGNVGSNIKFHASVKDPLLMYTGDMDGDKDRDIALAFKQGTYYHPDRSLTFLKAQFPSFDLKFPYYADFTGKSLEQIFGDALNTAKKHEVTELRSMILISTASGYDALPLPVQAQVSSINSILVKDLDGDGEEDFILAGNELYMPIQLGSLDAGAGLVLMNKGKGVLEPLSTRANGAFLPGWVKDMEFIQVQGVLYLIASRNDERPIFLKLNSSLSTIP